MCMSLGAIEQYRSVVMPNTVSKLNMIAVQLLLHFSNHNYLEKLLQKAKGSDTS